VTTGPGFGHTLGAAPPSRHAGAPRHRFGSSLLPDSAPPPCRPQQPGWWGGVRVWVVCALAASTACSPLAPRRQWEPSAGYEQLLTLARREVQSLDDLVAEARLTVRNGEQEQSATAVLQIKSPGMLRVEVRGPLYNHLLTAVVLADTLYVDGPAVAGRWYGPADGSLLKLLTGLDLGGYDLALALLGLVQPAPVLTTAAPERDGDLEVVRLEAPAGQVRRVWIDARRGLVRREELSAPGSGWSLTRRLSDYRQVGRALLPRRVDIVQGTGGIRLEYLHCWANRGVGKEVFLEAARQGDRRLVD